MPSVLRKELCISASESAHPLDRRVTASTLGNVFVANASEVLRYRLSLGASIPEYDFESIASFPTELTAPPPQTVVSGGLRGSITHVRLSRSAVELAVVSSKGEGYFMNVSEDSCETMFKFKGSKVCEEGWTGIALHPRQRASFAVVRQFSRSFDLFDGERFENHPRFSYSQPELRTHSTFHLFLRRWSLLGVKERSCLPWPRDVKSHCGTRSEVQPVSSTFTIDRLHLPFGYYKSCLMAAASMSAPTASSASLPPTTSLHPPVQPTVLPLNPPPPPPPSPPTPPTPPAPHLLSSLLY